MKRFWPRFSRKVAPSLDEALATIVTVAADMADELLAQALIVQPDHVYTRSDLTKTARFVAVKASGMMRDNLIKGGATRSAADLMTKPIEAKILAEIRTRLHAKAPMDAMEASGQA